MKRNRFILAFLSFILAASFAQSQSVDSLQRVLTAGTNREKANAAIQLGGIYKYNDPSKALEYANQAVSYAEQEHDETLEAVSYKLCAGILFRLGNFNKSKEYYQLAIGKYAALQRESDKAETQYALGGVCYAQGNFAQAGQNYLEALRYYESANHKAGMLNVYTSLANLYARQNSFSKSIDYNLKAIALYESESNKLQAVVVYDQIGNAYLKQQNLKKASEFFNKSLRTYREMNNQAGIASTLNQLGNIAFMQKDYVKADYCFNNSLKMALATKTPFLQVINYNALGNLYAEQKKYPLAVNMYKQAIRIAKPGDMKLELDEAYQGLSKVYDLTNEQKKATTYNTLSREIKDSVYNDSTLKRLSDLELRYGYEKKQRQLDVLSKEQQIKESELNSERSLNRIYLYAAIVIGIILVVLFYYFVQNKKFSASLQKQKNELEQKAVEITLQKEKLDQLNSVKDRFFSIISHDLRNNLTTMKLYFDLISHPEYKPEDQSEITRHISGSVENTIDLLENLLVWASAQIKGIPIHIQKLNMHTIAQENIHLLMGTATQKQIELVNHIDEEISAFGDMDMINLVLRNLISNAIKFTPEGGQIVVSARPDVKECEVSVKDNGIGISEENLEKMFDQHLHPTTKGTGNEKGTGLGLLLCKDFITQNNGKIWAESEKEKGTTFYFTLPVKHAES